MTANADTGSLRSNWAREAAAIWRKDVRVEWRHRHGVLTLLLFGISAVVAVGLATSTASSLAPDVQSGMLWVALLFAGMSGLGRGFIVEEEQGTADGLRIAASPTAVYLGKLGYHLMLLGLLYVVIVPLFMLFLRVWPKDWVAFLVILGLGGMGLTVATTTCGALVARASGKSSLLAVMAFPILIPLVALAVTGTKAALVGGSNLYYAWSSVGGLLAYATALLTVSLLVFSYVWREG